MSTAKRPFTLAVVLLMLLSMWPLGPASAMTTPPPELGSITIHKFEDVNGNGVQDDGEGDLAGWPMRIYRWDAGENPVEVARDVTDDAGNVTFGDLGPGRYKAWEAKRTCWALTTSGTLWIGGYYQVVQLAEGASVTVEFGNRNTCTTPPPPPEPVRCIDLEKTGPRAARPGEPVTYHFWVKNCGDIILQGGAQVYDPLFGEGPIWSGDLQPGQIVEFDKTYRLPEDRCDEFTNNAWAVGHPPNYPEVRDDDSWTVEVTCCDDTDGDGVCDDVDNCPATYNPNQADADSDGVGDVCDQCPNDPAKTSPGACGCGVADTDSDGDGTPDCHDNCPVDPNKTEPGACGCGIADTDSDGDGTPNCHDGCPADPDKLVPGVCGCGVPDTDSDGDGNPDCVDLCPDDPLKTAPGLCGCGVPDTDSDGDGTPDCQDNCPVDPNKTEPGACGCGIADTDSDGDGTPNCHDGCPADPDKVVPGVCGCGVPDTDSDGDGNPDCVDLCPDDPLKTAPGVCGCGTPDTDSDTDGVPDCNDGCPNDPTKVDPGTCGCGVPDTDNDGDGTPDCHDGCPADPNKTEPGFCGCGAPDPTPGPDSVTIVLGDSQHSTYDISLVSHVGNTWTYLVEEVSGRNLSHWSLGIASCLDHITAYNPHGADIGRDGSTGFEGIKWDVSSHFSSGQFSFTLDDDYPEGTVEALAKASNNYATGDIAGPVCACPGSLMVASYQSGADSSVASQGVGASPAPNTAQRAAPAAAGAVAATGLGSIAWWLIRRRLLLP